VDVENRLPHWALLVLSALIFAGVVVFVSHKVEVRSRNTAIRHSDSATCKTYNRAIQKVNLFHVTVFRFIDAARIARLREARALAPRPGEPATKRVKRVIKTDLRIAANYTHLLQNTKTVDYDKRCSHPKVIKLPRLDGLKH
jgi:hypothetical protein